MAKFKALMLVLLMTLSAMAAMVPASAGDGPAPMAKTDRIVLTELFTGAACGPCVNADYGLDDHIDSHTRDQSVALVYHRSIPAADKLEISDCVNRQAWYISSGGASTPNMWVDGKIVRVGGFSTRAQGEQWFDTQYGTRRATQSEFRVNVDATISPGLKGTVWVNVTALDTPSLSNLYLHTVIAREEYGPWNGGNGVNYHHWVVRKMMPSVNGESLSISSGQTVNKEYTFDLSSDQYTVEDDMVAVAFVQTHTRTDGGSNRYAAEILQTGFTEFNAVPNKAPFLRSGQAVVPDGADEDTTIEFKTFYWDLDDVGNGPAWVKVFYKNATSGVIEKALTTVPSGIPWTEGKWMHIELTLGAGTYTYRFAANDSEADASGDTAWNATEFTILPRNKLPQLSAQSFAPLDGDTNTPFTFQILYRDGDNEEPADARIYINDVAYTMTTSSSGPWNDWVLYEYEITLPVGENHRYYFMFSDGKASVRMPAVDASPNWLLGPFVEKPNNAPTLTTALFSPDEGTRMDEFRFTIVYTDGENDHPTVSYIYIDEVAAIMDPDGYDYANGEVFRYRTSLDLGEHSIRFLFNDGKNEVRFPASGSMPGPTVVNLDPVAKIASPSAGRYTPDQYITFSAIGSDDPESDSLEFRWTSSIDDVLSTSEVFDKQLTEGEHTIALEVSDEYGGTDTVSVVINVKALEPHPFVLRVEPDKTTAVEKDTVRFSITLANDGETRAQGIEVHLFVDGVFYKSDTTTVDVGNEVVVRISWEATEGGHDMKVEIPGDAYDFSYVVAMNTDPVAEPTVLVPKDKYKPGEEIMFQASASDANGDPVAYLWDFGDGITSTSEKPSHMYAAAGTYTVTLTVTDTRGGETVETMTIEVAKEQSSGGDSPGFGAVVAMAALMAVIVVMTRRRR